jgi:hypothetical protein
MRNILTFSRFQIKFRMVKLGTAGEVAQTRNTGGGFEYCTQNFARKV